MGVDPFPNAVLMLNEESLLYNYFIQPVLRVFNLSGFVARSLSGCHSALKRVRDETDEGVTRDTKSRNRTNQAEVFNLIPKSATIALMAFGLAGLGCKRREFNASHSQRF